jgi:hypothetical protein
MKESHPEYFGEGVCLAKIKFRVLRARRGIELRTRRVPNGLGEDGPSG